MEKIRVNGIEKEFALEDFPNTLKELLDKLNVDSTTVVAEIDGQIIERTIFEQTQISKGQNIELIRFVPGG